MWVDIGSARGRKNVATQERKPFVKRTSGCWDIRLTKGRPAGPLILILSVILRYTRPLVISNRLMLSTGQGQCRVKWGHRIKVVSVSCDTCFMVPLGRIIRWGHSFSHLTQDQVKFRSKMSGLEIQKCSLKKHTYVVQFCLRIPKVSSVLMPDN